MANLSVNVSRFIKAPIDAVFNAWLDPKRLSQFILPMKGMPNPVCESDPRVGGKFSILMVAGENTIPHHGEYKVIDRHSRIAFSWESPFSAEGSTVTLDLNEVEGGTNIQLTHVNFIDEEKRRDHAGGWREILNVLSTVVS